MAPTLAFEYLFGHYVLGGPWQQVDRVLDANSGELFTLVLVVSALAPWLAARLRDQV